MKAIVIGGGIGGLTAAIALQKAGIEAHAYERAPALREVGAGISLWANALHALDELGLANASRPHVLSELHAGLRTWRGMVLSSAASNELTKRFGGPDCGDAPGQAKRNLLQLFRGWHDPVQALIEAADESAILCNDIYDRDPLPRWSENRVTLLGDAAHPMMPNLGQGRCQAIEDAVVLAACLANCHQVESAFRGYQDRRIPRTSAIVLQSRCIAEIGQWENWFLCSVRNAAIRAVPSRIKARQIVSVAVYEALTEAERSLLAGL